MLTSLLCRFDMKETKKALDLLLWSLLPLLKRPAYQQQHCVNRHLQGSGMMSQLGRWTLVARRQMNRYHLFRLEEHHGCVFSSEVLKCQWSSLAMAC